MNLKETYDLPADEAEDGQIAVDKFKELLNKNCSCENRAYKLIFMDIQMPVKDGIQAAKQIMDLVKNAGITQSGFCNIVALTACTTDGVREQAIQAGMKDLLPKPISHDIIENVLFKYFFQFTDKMVEDYKRDISNAAQSANGRNRNSRRSN